MGYESVVDARLEGSVDWASIISNEHAKEEEMSRLVAGFVAQMHKRVAGSEGESTPISDGKHQKRSSLDEEAQKDWAIISVDSPDLAFNDHSVLEGTHSEASTPMEEGDPNRKAFQCRRNWRGGPIRGSCCSGTPT